MESPAAYIPADRRLAILGPLDLPERTTGTALFADISGFTPLTEALVRALGPQRGAEALPHQLNLIYDAVIAEVDRYAGSVIGFSGDAITCWFDRDDGSRATTCALAIQQTMQQFATVVIPGAGSVELAIKVAVAGGAVRRFLVGDPEIQLVDVLTGHVLDRLAGAEHLANKGDVVLGPHVAARLQDRLLVTDRRPDPSTGEYFTVINGMTHPADPDPWPAFDPQGWSPEQTRAWLLPPVYERLSSGLGEFLTELRPAVALFLRFGGIDYDDDQEACGQLDVYVRWVQGILVHYGGFLIQLTIGDKGSYLYAAFGAPVAHGDDANRAVTAALELRAPPPDLAFIHDVQIGISRGRMRTGAYGGMTRRTYGVLGDEVNMAARLMQHAAAGQVLVSQVAQQATGETFIWESLPPLRVKGKSQPVNVYRLVGPQARRAVRLQEPRYALPMVGRQAELAIINERLAQAIAGHGQIIGITADAGMGKSRLVAEAVRLATAAQMTIYGGECQSYSTNNSYLVWESIWQGFFDLDPTTAIDDQAALLEQQLAAIDPLLVPRLPLLSAALNLPLPDNDLTRSLDAKLRKTSLEALLVDCVRARARHTPLLFLLEDCHWLDPLSHDLLEAIGRSIADVPVLMLIDYRPPELEHLQAPQVTLLPHSTVIPLPDFTADEAARLIALKLHALGTSTDTLPATFIESITARAQGNPFYIEELLNYLRDRGLDPHNTTALAQLDLPSNLHSLILSRIDQLSERQKLTIKVASVVGRLFQFGWLWGVHPLLGPAEQIKGDLDSMHRLDLTPLDQPEPQLTYLFKHIVTREVAYESLPFATRELFHGQLAAFIEHTYADSLGQQLDLLAYHYDLSTNLGKKREYLRRAGDAAKAAYANETAIDYYTRLLAVLEMDAERQHVEARLGEVLSVTGHYDTALEHLHTSLELASALADSDALAQTCRWIAYVYEFRSEFAPAQAWIERGLQALGERETSAKAELLAIAGLISTRQGHYDRAQDQCAWSIQTAQQLKDSVALGFAYNSRAVVFYKLGENRKAIADTQTAADLYQQAENIQGAALAYNGLGNAYFEMGEWSKANAYYEKARHIFVQTGDELHRVFADNNLGGIALNQGRLDDALAFYTEALNSLQRNHGSSYVIGVLHMNLGATCVHRHELPTAYEHFRLSEEYFTRAESRDFLAELHRHRADAALKEGDLDAATAQCQLSLSIARELSMRGEEGCTRRVLGAIAAVRGDFAQSESDLMESRCILDDVNQEYEAARTTLVLAQVYAAQSQTGKCAAALEQCIPVFQLLDAALDLATARQLLSDAPSLSAWSIG